MALGFFVFVGGLAYLGYKQDKKRTEEFQRVANELGWSFHPKGDAALLGRLSGFHLFSQGSGRRMKNLVYARREGDGGDVALFGYQFTIDGGEDSTTYRQNVAYFQSPGLNLPKFVLRMEHFFHKIGSVFGYQDIDFTSRPDFSKRYLLRGDDEMEIKKVFTDEVLSFYEGKINISTEADGDHLIYYREGKTIQSSEVVAFLEEASEVFKLFKGQ